MRSPTAIWPAFTVALGPAEGGTDRFDTYAA